MQRSRWRRLLVQPVVVPAAVLLVVAAAVVTVCWNLIAWLDPDSLWPIVGGDADGR